MELFGQSQLWRVCRQSQLWRVSPDAGQAAIQLTAVPCADFVAQDLPLHQLGIKASFIHELLVGPLLYHAALVENNDVVCLLHSAEPVGYHQHCVALNVTINGSLDLSRGRACLKQEVAGMPSLFLHSRFQPGSFPRQQEVEISVGLTDGPGD